MQVGRREAEAGVVLSRCMQKVRTAFVPNPSRRQRRSLTMTTMIVGPPPLALVGSLLSPPRDALRGQTDDGWWGCFFVCPRGVIPVRTRSCVSAFFWAGYVICCSLGFLSFFLFFFVPLPPRHCRIVSPVCDSPWILVEGFFGGGRGSGFLKFAPGGVMMIGGRRRRTDDLTMSGPTLGRNESDALQYLFYTLVCTLYRMRSAGYVRSTMVALHVCSALLALSAGIRTFDRVVQALECDDDLHSSCYHIRHRLTAAAGEQSKQQASKPASPQARHPNMRSGISLTGPHLAPLSPRLRSCIRGV